MTCVFPDCFQTAHWNPVLVLHAHPKYHGPDYAPTYARTSYAVCDFHRTQLTPEALVPDAEWPDIVREFERTGQRRPSRPHVALTFDAVSEMTRVIDVRKPFVPPNA